MLKRIFKKLIYKEKADRETYKNHLRKIGVTIGENSEIYDPVNTHIDETRPYMIRIGKNVSITRGITILTHGYDWSVIKYKTGKVLGSCGEVVIGDNVFIGMNTTILKGVHIGNDVIIGANALVNKDLEGGYVYAGNPAKQICPIEKYAEKLFERQLAEAESLYLNYVRAFNKEPDKKEFSEFFFLFEKRDTTPLPDYFTEKLKLTGNYEKSLQAFNSENPPFNGFEEFLKHMREINK